MAEQGPEDMVPLWPEERGVSEDGAAGGKAGTKQAELSAWVSHRELTWTEEVAAIGALGRGWWWHLC